MICLSQPCVSVAVLRFSKLFHCCAVLFTALPWLFSASLIRCSAVPHISVPLRFCAFLRFSTAIQFSANPSPRCSLLSYSFAVQNLASHNPALAFLCVSTLHLCDSQQCAAIPLRLISVLCISLALHTFAFQFLYFTGPLTAFHFPCASLPLASLPLLHCSCLF